MKVKLIPDKAMEEALAPFMKGRKIDYIYASANQMDILKFNAKKAKNLKVHKRPVLCISTGISYSSIQEASKALGVRPGAISRVCSNKQHTTKGYKFSYKDNK